MDEREREWVYVKESVCARKWKMDGTMDAEVVFWLIGSYKLIVKNAQTFFLKHLKKSEIKFHVYMLDILCSHTSFFLGKWTFYMVCVNRNCSVNSYIGALKFIFFTRDKKCSFSPKTCVQT
jgi:hypothetical protein